jgi:hypothetical protein
MPTLELKRKDKAFPPWVPLTLTFPLIVTSPEARILRGVLGVFFVKVTVTPAGIFTVVK